MISLSNAQFHYEVCICYAYLPWIELPSLWVHYQWCEFTRNSFTFSRIYYEFTIGFANSLWIHSLFRGIPSNSLCIRIRSDEFALISLSNTRIHNEFTTELFYDYSRINYDLFISKANSLWIYYFSRRIPIFAMSSVSNSRIHYKFSISCSYSLWSYFLLGISF